MASIKIFLQRLGFTQNEAAVYDFLLKEGSATAQEIYKALSINRVTVYEIMKRFLKRGFVSKSKRVGKDLFVLESPDRLKDLIAEKKLAIKRLEMEAKELEEVFEDDFKQIKQVQEAREKEVEVKFVQDVEEFDKFYSGSKSHFYIYEVFNKKLVAQWYPYDKKRQKRRENYYQQHKPYPILAIYSGDSKKDKLPIDHLKHPTNNLYLVPDSKYPIKGEIYINEGEIRLLDYTNKQFKVIILKSKQIAQTLITLINMAAETAKRDALHIKESKIKPPKRIV